MLLSEGNPQQEHFSASGRKTAAQERVSREFLWRNLWIMWKTYVDQRKRLVNIFEIMSTFVPFCAHLPVFPKKEKETPGIAFRRYPEHCN